MRTMVVGLGRIQVAALLIAVSSSLWLGRIGAVAQLSVNFYQKTCPDMESVIRGVMVQKLRESPLITAPATLRLFFHDCFVDGCDGSVLISSPNSERDAPPNLSLAGDAFEVVSRAKSVLEKSCPNVVSCADILAVLARDATALVNGPSWAVAKGRRDGRLSLAANANMDLPRADFKFDQMLAKFASKGLSTFDMVVLSGRRSVSCPRIMAGAHTIGHSHCAEVTKRLYKFSPRNATDPSMDAAFARSLKQACPPSGGDSDVMQPFDGLTPFQFDNSYYNGLRQHRGLLASDQLLFSDGRTRATVLQFANNQTLFFSAFADAMQKLGSVGIKTGNEGEIRKDCTRFN